jgi:cyclic pyranopterin phosphate synthase
MTQELQAREYMLTHLNPEGGVHMVDVSAKPDTVRTAVASGRVILPADVLRAILAHEVRKGDVLTVAQIAGILGAKQTSQLIPLCHHVNLTGVDMELKPNEETSSIEIRAFTKATGPTGVEMEALTAVAVAALTIYDMCKSLSKEIVITDIQLLAKTGGASGDYRKALPR